MAPEPDVRPFRPDEAEALAALRAEALEAHPLAFCSAKGEDRLEDLGFVREALADVDNRVTFGAFVDGEPVGMAGLMRGSRAKLRHKAGIWGMYVRPSARGLGLGRRLLDAAIDRARTWPEAEVVTLSVTEAAAEAQRLYERAGFVLWGREPGSVQWQGRVVDELHMRLPLRGPAEG